MSACGDPRTSSSDPVDYIECIPISETRNYVMRVLEGMQVYRARLNGGRAPLTLAADLKRGGYGSALQVASTGGPTIDSLLEGSLGSETDAEAAVVASTPVPNPPEIQRVDPGLERRAKHRHESHGGKAHKSERSAPHGKSKASGEHAKPKHKSGK